MSSKLPNRLAIVAGTYDGVLAGWDTIMRKKNDEEENKDDDNNSKKKLLQLLNDSSSSMNDSESYLKMNFAMPVHEGSVRCISLSSGHNHNYQKDENQANQTNERKENDNEKENDESGVGSIQNQKLLSNGDDVDMDDKNTLNYPIVPGTLLSGGYDESIALFSLTKHIQNGELKTPSSLGTPTCSAFAPPYHPSPSHVLIGLSTGKIVIYKRKDMTVQHILPGHDIKGVTAIAVHPSGKMALSGGRDGKICLWDLMRGRLAFVSKIQNKDPSLSIAASRNRVTVNHIIWSKDGNRFAFCTHEGNITVREMESGQDLLDIQMPTKMGRANQICFVGGDDGLFLAAACNDGGLPLFAVGSVDEEDEEVGTRRAMMAIEPVTGVATAGDERFKCIESIEGGSGFLVVTANSGGIISVIDLEGAAQMMLSDDKDADNDEDENDIADDDADADADDDDDNMHNSDGRHDSEYDDQDLDSDDEEDVAAEILESVRIGTGARITCISTWSYNDPDETQNSYIEEIENGVANQTTNDEVIKTDVDEKSDLDQTAQNMKKRKSKSQYKSGKEENNEIEMDEEALERARELVSQAKKRQKRKKKKKKNVE